VNEIRIQKLQENRLKEESILEEKRQEKEASISLLNSLKSLNKRISRIESRTNTNNKKIKTKLTDTEYDKTKPSES
jgi:hypothetical protein